MRLKSWAVSHAQGFTCLLPPPPPISDAEVEEVVGPTHPQQPIRTGVRGGSVAHVTYGKFQRHVYFGHLACGSRSERKVGTEAEFRAETSAGSREGQ